MTIEVHDPNSSHSEFLPLRKYVDLLDTITFMSLSTSSLHGEPWCSPVFYGIDDDLNFYWLSSPEAVHSKNIHENSKVSIVVYNSTLKDGDGWGIYFHCTARIIQDYEIDCLERAIEICYKKMEKPSPSYKKFQGQYPRRYYTAKPHKVSVNGVIKNEIAWVDIRKDLSLEDIINLRRSVE